MKKFGDVTNIEKDSYFIVIKLESQGNFPFGRLVIIFFMVLFIHKISPRKPIGFSLGKELGVAFSKTL
jgi:hypothetical protein